VFTGASFTGFTVRTKLLLVVAAPSLTLTVMVDVPDCSAAGVMVSVLLAPDPPKLMLELGTSVVFEEVPLRVRLAAGVPASPTVKAIAPVEVSSFVDWLEMAEIVGATLFTVTVKLAGV
jgi:hypothetical protein